MKRSIILIAFIVFIFCCINRYSFNANLSSDSSEMNVVVAESMEPVLHRGDIVIVENPGKLNVGDIVVYNPTGFNQPVIHRIIGIKKVLMKKYYTK